MYVMRSLTLTALGATIAALIGYFYIEDEDGIIKKLIYSFIRKNPKLFKRQSSPEETLEMIKKGESESCEFKSTLRMSLHSNQVDKRVEQMCLKTITALMNSDGGTLLIGVGDNGEISGIEKDGFENSDKFALHFSNLINQHIGKEFIRLLDFESITIEDKNVFRVECLKSDKPVFIKASDGEKFFIRSGPSSIEIAGRELVEYIGRRFGKI
jgi:predicted HTH transcriptional regulator